MAIRIKTKPYGECEIDDRQIIEFQDGIFGFDFVKRFVLLDSQDNGLPFKWLQAYEESELAFVIIEPLAFMDQYALVISGSDLEAVGASKPEDVLVFAIVTIPGNPSDMTANLQGPVIINPSTRKGRQAISLSDRYGVRHRILNEMKKTEGEG